MEAFSMDNPFESSNPKYSNIFVLEVWNDNLTGHQTPCPIVLVTQTKDLDEALDCLMAGQGSFNFEHRLYLN